MAEISRGHAFVRYADDCNIYLRSQKAGLRVMVSVTHFVEQKLKLKVNQQKSAVDRAHRRTFLGYSFTWHKIPKIRVPKESVKRFRAKIKALCRKGKGRNIKQFIQDTLNPVIRGWINYFKLAEVKSFAEELDGWIRRRLRLILWRQWKRNYTSQKEIL